MSEPLVGGTTASNTTLANTTLANMANTTLANTSPNFLLDGELPRLGGTPAAPAAPAPASPGSTSTFAAPPASAPAIVAPPPGVPSAVSSAPGSVPVLGDLEAPSLPAQPTGGSTRPVGDRAPVTLALPTLPTVTPTVHHAAPPVETAGTAPTATDEHPMAHLMPAKTAPSEASRRAAELRAAKKAKARKVKIGVAIGALAVAAIVWPPLGKWFVDAINAAGTTSTDVQE